MTIANTTQAAEMGYWAGIKARRNDLFELGTRVAWCDKWAESQCPSDDRLYKKIYARQFKKAYFNNVYI